MGNLPALLPNATPVVSRFFGGMSRKRQSQRDIVDLENNFSISAQFADVYCNCQQQLLSQNKW
jgi:hypothetical protein